MNQSNIYSDIINNHPVLTAEKEKKLLAEAKKGSKRALNELVFSNLRYVQQEVSALKYRGNLESNDLIQYGIQGLVEGIRRFKTGSNVRLLTYVKYWIINSLYEGIRCSEEIVVPVKKVGKVNFRYRSMNAPVSTDNESYEFGETIRDESDFVEDVCCMENSLNLRRMISSLPERQRYVVEEHFGFNGGKGKSCREIGRNLGFSGQYIHEILTDAMETLRNEEYLRWYDNRIAA